MLDFLFGFMVGCTGLKIADWFGLKKKSLILYFLVAGGISILLFVVFNNYVFTKIQ